MSRHKRHHGIDETYGVAHRYNLECLYERVGHRLDVADRDWTEYCSFCREPLAIYEELRDVGQDLMDKGVSATRRLAERAQLPALVVAWQTGRPPDVQARIDALHQEIRCIEDEWPITKFRVRRLWPQRDSGYMELSPDEWWSWLAFIHRSHHQDCPKAAGYPVLVSEVEAAISSRLHEPTLFEWSTWIRAAR